MRLICTLNAKGEENPYELSYYLASEGIVNDCEEVNTPEGVQCRIWVYEEDDFDKALDLYKEFQKNPADPKYRAHSDVADRLKNVNLSMQAETENSGERPRRRRLLSPAPYGVISVCILIIVISLFISAQIQRDNFVPPTIPGVLQAPILAPVERALLYDYPHYFELRDQLLREYSAEDIEKKNPPSKEAAKLIRTLKKTPVWVGIYELILRYVREASVSPGLHAPLFEKIGQGEVWRLFTPVLLHLDLLHIFFNVLWFILLGNQVEFRLGWVRYILLILLTAVVSNTCQYLMSGTFFMGLSGTIVGLAAFIWARQQLAPWEGYLLHRYTLFFLAVFVVGMFFLQLFLFALQVTGKLGWGVGIANTAHLTGGIVGYLLGRSRFFALHPSVRK